MAGSNAAPEGARGPNRMVMRREAVVLALLAVAAVATTAWFVRGRGGDAALARSAREAVAERRFDEARPLVEAWIRKEPSDAEAYYLLGRIEVAQEHPDAALQALKAALDRGFDSERLNVYRAVLMARAGNHAAAEPILRRAFDGTSAPEAEVAEGLARVYLSTFRFGPASAAINRWMRAAPEDARPYLWRNEIDSRTDADPEVLVRNYRMALQRDPNLDKARLGLADSLRGLKRSDEAEAEYEAYLKRNPKSVEAHVGAGQTALDKGDVATAVRYFERALSIDPKEPVALRELALLDVRDGQPTRACERLRKAVEVDRFDPTLRAEYARALKLAGKAAEAKEQSEEGERLRKEHQRMTEIRVALVGKPEDLKLRSEAARWLLEHGHEQEGLEWTALILKKQPGHPETCAALSEYYRRVGNLGLANYYSTAAGKAGPPPR